MQILAVKGTGLGHLSLVSMTLFHHTTLKLVNHTSSKMQISLWGANLEAGTDTFRVSASSEVMFRDP